MHQVQLNWEVETSVFVLGKRFQACMRHLHLSFVSIWISQHLDADHALSNIGCVCACVCAQPDTKGPSSPIIDLAIILQYNKKKACHFSMTWVQDGTSVCAVLRMGLQISPASFGTKPKYIRAWKPHPHKNKLYQPPSKFSFQDVSLVAPCSTHP